MDHIAEGDVRPEFARIPFIDAEKAGDVLDSILSAERPGLAGHLAEALLECPDPSAALVRLEHYLSMSVTPHVELDVMAAMRRYTRLLITVLSQSQFLTDILCRNPEYMMWLWEEADLKATPPRDRLIGELLRAVQAFDSFDAQCAALRRFRRREILRIAAREVFEHASVAAVTQDLSNLADAAIEAALYCSRKDLERRFGAPRSADAARAVGFVVLGMGKLGGSELNFSSDIDLIFLYSEDGATTGGQSGSVSNAEYFHKLGERIIKALAELTPEGNVFRVDMRLRPHGRMAPLAIDVESAIVYYEREGRAWERQALIKARPCAGDIQLGNAFVERTRPFVFPRYFDDETLEDIRHVKRQMESLIEQRGETGVEVKLGRGGIRDIEFTVQMLQLLNGGRVPELRARNTLEAIRQLGLHGLLKPLDAAELSSNYIFLRQVEHRLQIEGSQQRHCLPSDARELDAFARRLGYDRGESFMHDYTDRTAATRAILEQFLATEGSGNLWVTELLNPSSAGEAGLEQLRDLGFRDAQAARAELLRLYAGEPDRPHSLHVRQRFLKVAPILLKALANCTQPDATLRQMARILSNLQAPSAIYDILLLSPDLSGHLVQLVENSEFLTDLMIRDPGLFDTFGRPGALDRPSTRKDLEEEFDALSRAYDREAAPYRLHAGETLRIGMRDLILGVDVVDVGHELTLLAEVCLGAVVDAAIAAAERRYGPAEPRFAVLALGKFGGCELGYGSDLDLVFVYESGKPIASGLACVEYFSFVASQIIKTLKEPTRYGSLYDIDARLRPDGRKGTLVISDDRLRQYYREEAQPWERLALVKVRAVAGDRGFAREVEGVARELAFGLPLTDASIANIEEVRAKIVASSTQSSLKKDEGGLVELEFAVRLLQLRVALHAPQLKRGDVLGAIDALAECGALDTGDAQSLRDAYLLFRRIENRLRVRQGRSTSRLPEDASARAELARRLGIEGDLGEVVQAHKQRVHRLYRRVLAEASSRP